MTQPENLENPENPFVATGVGARYAAGRPYHHPRALERAHAALGAGPFGRALDVACGTGLSTRALCERSGFVVGVDRSREMLAEATQIDGPMFLRSDAERLPFPDAAFDVVTVGCGVHWFDQARFFAEARRVLRPEGSIVLYDHYFIGEMVDVPEFTEWCRATLERFPLPPRNLQVGDPRAKCPAGFDKVADEFWADDIAMTHAQLVAYQLSISNIVDAVARGASLAGLGEWIAGTTAPFFADAKLRSIRFLGSLTCLRRAPQ